MQEKCFAVIGEDGRQRAAAAYLEKLGYRVVGAEQLAAADVIVLPMPLADDRAALAALLRSAKPGAVAYAGKVGAEASQLARQAKVELIIASPMIRAQQTAALVARNNMLRGDAA